ncbi:MAG: DUF1616 domain-containing protein [Chloroflexi bacterium]|uniref:DUF1616 domain-containing protein n=1 Tax=Candidatus Chlorohelix allophototropha TaxID=3003348 RepID=A0A8T7M1R9_9CHLR|nr:DUF1616 domain-containing protein [Chloroflexota bacterium]WJW67560.1 DUF1616 domain-containing protein [Chloroflexota bacterium L227-S17]
MLKGLKVQSNNFDLLLITLLALLLPVVVQLSLPWLRVPFGLIMVLLAPGYAMLQAIFNSEVAPDWISRLALSFGLSLTAVALLVLILNLLPQGINLWSITISVSLWVILFSVIAVIRRGNQTRLIVEEPKEVSTLEKWQPAQNSSSRLIYIVGGLVVVVLLSLLLIELQSSRSEHLTEFYILGSTGKAENYPYNVVIGQPIKIQAGITNRENRQVSYRIEIRDGLEVLARTEVIKLENEGFWLQPLQFNVGSQVGIRTIDLLLYFDNNLDPYRQLRLRLNVN